MSTAVAVNDSSTKKTPLNKVIAIGLAAFSVIEAVITFVMFIRPYFIKPVYDQVAAYNEQGITCTVKLFGKLFASAQDKLDYQIILSLSSTILNIVLIYIVALAIPLLLAWFFFKGYAFAKSYLTIVFAAKGVFGLVPMLIPFANVRNNLRFFGIGDAVLCFAVCAFFVYLNSMEYADDMLYTPEQTAAMKKRGIDSLVMFGVLAVGMVCEHYAMVAGSGRSALGGGNWSILLGWINDTAVAQGVVLALITAIAAIAAITYVRDADWSGIFFKAFGAVMAVVDLIGIVMKVTSSGVGKSTIFLIAAFVLFAGLTAYAFFRTARIKFAFVPKEKADLAVLLFSASLLLSTVLTIVANLLFDKQLYGGVNLGAMDYMYLIVYAGAALFLALAFNGGYSFAKFGALGLYLVVASCGFENIFVVFSARKAFIASNPGLHGYNYIIAGVLYIAVAVSCLLIIPAFAFKGVDDHLYAKRFS
mgnify:FL=1